MWNLNSTFGPRAITQMMDGYCNAKGDLTFASCNYCDLFGITMKLAFVRCTFS